MFERDRDDSADLPPDFGRIKVGWMDPDAHRFPRRQTAGETRVPQEGSATPPCRTRAPDARGRGESRAARQMDDLGPGRGVKESGIAERLFDLRIEKPRGRDETLGAESVDGKRGEPLLHEAEGGRAVEGEEFGFARRVKFLVEPPPEASLDRAFYLSLGKGVAPAVQDDLMPFLLPAPQPADEGGVLVEGTGVPMAWDHEEAHALHPETRHLVHLPLHGVKVERGDVVDRNDEGGGRHEGAIFPQRGRACHRFLERVIGGSAEPPSRFGRSRGVTTRALSRCGAAMCYA